MSKAWWRDGKEIVWSDRRWAVDDVHTVWEADKRKVKLFVCYPHDVHRPCLWSFCFFLETSILEDGKWRLETFFPVPLIMIDLIVDWLGMSTSFLLERLQKRE